MINVQFQNEQGIPDHVGLLSSNSSYTKKSSGSINESLAEIFRTRNWWYSSGFRNFNIHVTT